MIKQVVDDQGVAAAHHQVNRRTPFLVLPINNVRQGVASLNFLADVLELPKKENGQRCRLDNVGLFLGVFPVKWVEQRPCWAVSKLRWSASSVLSAGELLTADLDAAGDEDGPGP